MTKLVLKYISIIFVIYILSIVLDTVSVHNIPALLIMGLVLLLVNLVIKPILLAIALPFNLLTFGVFSVVVNALTILIADGFVPGVNLGGFVNCLLAALFIVIFNNLLLDWNHPRKEK